MSPVNPFEEGHLALNAEILILTADGCYKKPSVKKKKTLSFALPEPTFSVEIDHAEPHSLLGQDLCGLDCTLSVVHSGLLPLCERTHTALGPSL